MRKLTLTEYIKFFASSLLIISVLLPISSCTKNSDFNEKSSAITENKNFVEVTRYNYVWNDFNINDIGNWLLLLCYLWPLFIFIHRYKTKNNKIKIVIWGVEPILLSLSSYFIYVISNILATPSIGAYIAHLANSIYCFSWLNEFTNNLIFKKNNWNFLNSI